MEMGIIGVGVGVFENDGVVEKKVVKGEKKIGWRVVRDSGIRVFEWGYEIGIGL